LFMQSMLFLLIGVFFSRVKHKASHDWQEEPLQNAPPLMYLSVSVCVPRHFSLSPPDLRDDESSRALCAFQHTYILSLSISVSSRALSYCTHRSVDAPLA
jgi:hypothetical protein